MALKIYEKFAPRANPGDTNYPNGSIKNESAPGTKDGTPLDADWGNDYVGFDSALFAETGVTPTGDPDTALASQRLDALKKLPVNNISLPYVFDTFADMVASTIKFPTGKKLVTKNYYTGIEGGGATSTQAVGASPHIGSPAMSQGGYADLEILGEIIPKQWGVRAAPEMLPFSYDSSTITQAIYNYMTEYGVGVCSWGEGRFYFASNVNQPVVNDGLGTNPVYNIGAGINATELFTDQNIDMFTHQDNFAMKSLSIAQRGADGVTKYTGVALRSNGQCRKCRFEDLDVWWFKFGNLQRFSLWNVYKKVTYNGNLCGIKLARSSDMENPSNPSPPGVWNAGDGWFHNLNSFDTIIFNGDKESSGGRGEIGFWGAIQGNTFRNITAQNYERSGAIPNQTIPLGQVSTCIQIEGGGPTSTDARGNIINGLYFERSFKGLKTSGVDALIINQWFTQGQAGGENLLECDDSKITINGQVNQTTGWSADIVATNSNITVDRPLQSNGGSNNRSLTNSYLSENGVPIQEVIRTSEVTITPEFSGTITVKTDADEIAYERIGNYVPFTGRVDVDSVTGTGASSTYIEIGGMPFSVGNATQRAGNASVNVTVFGGVNGTEIVPAILLENASAIRVFVVPSTMTGNEQFFISGHYFTTAFS